jgi:hypothetical protein
MAGMVNNGCTRDKATGFTEYKDAFSAYEDGKQRRYQLLFAVNGGVLAISNVSHGAWRNLLLSVLMIFFTIVMAADIRSFGERFHGDHPDMFGKPGQRVLRNMSLLLCLAWLGLGLSTFVASPGVDPGGGPSTAACRRVIYSGLH